MKRTILIILPILFLQTIRLFAQIPVQTIPVQTIPVQTIRSYFNEQNAYQTVAFVEQRWRLAGNNGFNESIGYVEKILKEAGFIRDDEGRSAATLTYRIEKRPMKRPAWEPVDAQLWIVGEAAPLLSFSTNRNMLAIYSASTPEGGVTAELIESGNDMKKDTGVKDLKGKILMADGDIGGVYANAARQGAIGALSYSMPGYTQPEKYRHSIQFSNIGYTDSLTQRWGILLSYDARERLKAALARGPVQLKVITKTKIYPSEELTIVADVKGAVKPEERFVFSAHVQEPGANDNATGVGTLAEMARVTARLVQEGKLKPQRTLTFLWGDEIVSTRRYIKEDSIRARGIKWGLSLDMVGEDTKKTGGTFLIEKMPDPSAIWTRGNDKHSEWGGSPLSEADLFPHYFNDVLLNRCRAEAAGTGWVVKTNPFEGGSDHTPFLQAKIPGLLMWHFTDVFYHTDADRLDKVSSATMRHVGVSALSTAYLLTTANSRATVGLIRDVTRNALERLQNETAIGKANIKGGGDADKENHILGVWRDWYLKAVELMSDIPVIGVDANVKAEIAASRKKILKAIHRL